MKNTFNQKKVHKSNAFMEVFLIMIGLFLVSINSFAEQKLSYVDQKKANITGVVKENDGTPLIGVSITVVGTKSGTVTNLDGQFSIEAAPSDILEISYIGFANKKITVGTRKHFNITLQEESKALDEVVVIGYGTVKKSDLTGSVSTVKTDDIADIPVPRVDQMLQGRIAGAEFVSTSGEPGAGTSIRIRGTRSISATNEPLFVVDGVMDAITDLNDLNPSDIKSIEVLKDASSTAIYGSRGSNGVIIITTKSGDSNDKTKFTFRADIGFSQLPKYLNVMNAAEFAQLQNDRFYFFSKENSSKPIEEYPYPDPLSLGEGTNWTREITRTAPYQNYFLSSSGGDKKTTYYFSANYNNSQGIIINSGLKRYQGRLNIDRKINKYVKSGLKINYTYIDQEQNKADLGTHTLWYRSALFLAPVIPAYKEDGSYNDWNSQWYSGTLFDSPLAVSELTRKDMLRKTLNAMIYAEVRPIENLLLKSYISFYNYDRYLDRFSPSTLPTRANKGQGAYAYKNSFKDNNILNENTISYNTQFDNHKLDFLYGFTYQTFWNNSMSQSGDGYFVDATDTNSMQSVPSKETVNISSGMQEQTKLSNLIRLNYNYAGKYYLTATARADGSSNFASGHKWGYFPSLALKWNLSKEKFMENVSNVMNQASIRYSMGLAGNDAISKYSSLAALGSTSNGYLFNGVTPVGYYPNRIANNELTWEKTMSYNMGVDLSFFRNRLSFSADIYYAKTRDLLLTVQLPSHTGFDSRMANIGKTSNKGIELTFNSKNIYTKNFTWSSTLTLAHNSQKVDDIGGYDRVISFANSYGPQYAMYAYEKGKPLNALWGMQYAGVWKSDKEIETHDNSGTNLYVSAAGFKVPGRQRYIDQNRDGVLDNKDLVYLGNADPNIYGGIQNTFNIYGFNLSIYFNYSLGGKIYNPVELFMGTGTYLCNQFKYMTNAWHPERNPYSDIPRADSKDDIPNDRFVHDASFLRLKNISLSYTFNLGLHTKGLLKSLTLTASGNNLYLWKKYNGYDPEVSTQSGGATIRRMDNGAYPASRTFTFSTQLNF